MRYRNEIRRNPLVSKRGRARHGQRKYTLTGQTPDLLETITDALGDTVIRLLARHVGFGPDAIAARDEVQAMFFTLARYSEGEGRSDVAKRLAAYGTASLKGAQH